MNMSKKPTTHRLIGLAVFFFLLISYLAPPAGIVHAGTIVGSKHDFSSFNNQGLGGFAGNFQVQNASGFQMVIDEVCVFCHTPHGASRNVPGYTQPVWLWNRTNSPPPGYTYSMYQSPTLSATIAATPTGVSMMCMSCHDGVTSIAVNTLLNAPGSGNGTVTTVDGSQGVIGNIYNGTFLGWGPNIGETYPGGPGTINLSNDHPISFEWPTNKPGLKTVPSDTRLRLFGLSGQRMECATCHAVHDPSIVPFLAMSNTNSNMCTACHLK
jgi:hypothetical protein